MAATILLRIVRETFTFDKEVAFHDARTLRDILVSKDVAWKNMTHKDAEEKEHTGAWAILLPREHVRREAELVVRTLLEKEEPTLARYREAASRAMVAERARMEDLALLVWGSRSAMRQAGLGRRM